MKSETGTRERFDEAFWSIAPELPLVKEMPISIQLDDKPLALDWRKASADVWQGTAGDLSVTIEVKATADGSKALAWATTLRNGGSVPIKELQILPLHLPMEVDPEKDGPVVRHLSGSYHYDGVYPPRAFRVSEEQFLTHDHCKPVRIQSSTLGAAGEHVPILQFAVRRNGGLAGFAVGFEWSSRWYLEAGWWSSCFKGEPRSRFVVHGNVELAAIELAPGEELRLPTVHVVFFEGADWDAADNALRAYTRDHLSARLRGAVPVPPVSYDHWFGIHEGFDVQDLKRQADRAAGLGCEYFCLDASWYACREQWTDGIGNWFTPEPTKFPHGIEELSEHVRAVGMGFGIWHQIQRAAADTEMIRRYPGLFHPDGSGGGFLRFELPEAQEAALDLIRGWIRRWHLTWMRFEFLEPECYVYKVDPSGKLAFAYVHGLWRVMDVLREEFPDLYIECCQGGGTKLEWGMSVRTHGAWLSDHTAHPDVCRFMQTGASRFWPAHFLNSAIRVHRGSGDAEATLRNLLSRMVGTLSFNGDIAQWSEAATREMRRGVEIYKQIRPLLSGDVHFPLPQPRSGRDWDAVLFSGKTGRLLFLFRMKGDSTLNLNTIPGTWQLLLGTGEARLTPEGHAALLINGAALFMEYQ